MKKTVQYVAIGLVIILVLKGSGVLDALLFFIIVGALPGTQASLSPSMTLAVLTLIVALSVLYLVVPSYLSSHDPVQHKKKPRRRYGKL